ncbi:MAG: hypothetical protein WB587_13895 [Nitrososphaeraceae archaeon]
MRYVGYFLLTFIAGVTMIMLTLDRNSVFSSTSENNSVLQQAQRSLEANQKQLATVSPEPVPNVVPSAVQEIKGTSMH